MENQNSSYSVQIGKTTFIVCVKQSETAKKPIEKMFKDFHKDDSEKCQRKEPHPIPLKFCQHPLKA